MTLLPRVRPARAVVLAVALLREQISMRGQALVETALLLPLILILLLGAIDFGRVFFGWVTLHQAARIGANYAATHPAMTPSQQDDFVELISADMAAINCDADRNAPAGFDLGDIGLAYARADGTPTAIPELGDYAEVDLACEMGLLTPLASILFGDPIPMTAESTFPVRTGCINCPGAPPVPPPPPPEQCRTVPDMIGLSGEGARQAWISAGFIGDFEPLAGQDTETVETQTVTEDDPLSTCEEPTAIFSSSVSVTFAEADPPSGGCATVPNLIGFTVLDARDIWEDTFSGEFLPAPPDEDDRRVVGQETTPSSDPGVSCLETTASVVVTTGDPWPAPPPTPCKVPNLTNQTRNAGEAEWFGPAGFTGTFSPANGNWVIESQSLVGGTWQPCDAAITVAKQAQP